MGVPNRVHMWLQMCFIVMEDKWACANVGPKVLAIRISTSDSEGAAVE